jgi:hypothetical protein
MNAHELAFCLENQAIARYDLGPVAHTFLRTSQAAIGPLDGLGLPHSDLGNAQPKFRLENVLGDLDGFVFAGLA